jgi:peptidoglycan hydrolase CwlO-like protein
MSNPVIVETDLKDILAKIENRLDRIEQKLEALPRIEAEITQLKVDVTDLKGSQRSQIWVLIVTVVGAIIKFGFFPNP